MITSLLGLSALLLAGCGGGGETSSENQGSGTSAASSSADHSNVNYNISIGSPEAQSEYVKGLAEQWLADNGYTNVTVEMVTLNEGDTGNRTDWASGPEIYAFASDQILTLLSKSALAKVPSAYAKAMESEMTEAAYATAKVGDSVYAYPYAGDNGYFLFYNTDYVTAEQATTLTGLSEAATAAGKKICYTLKTAFYGIGAMFTYGSRYDVQLAADGKSIASVTADFDGANGMKAIKAMQQIMTDTNFETSAADAAPTGDNNFIATVSGSWNVAAYTEALGDKLGMAALPSVTVDGETKPLGSYLGYKLYGVNPQVAGDDTTRLALDHQLANYFVSEEVQSDRFDKLTIAPTNKAVSEMDKVTNTPHVKVLAEQAASGAAVAQTIVPSGIWGAGDALYASLAANPSATETELQTMIDTFNAAVCAIS
jgi:arabinogalactan oligomer/maltooligosaccharide transport system substrate-binding protein